MNKSECQAILEDVMADTFQNLTMMFAVTEEETLADPADPMHVVRVGFTGPFSGTLYLGLCQICAPELASNMLGCAEDEPSFEMIEDALCETSNVLCGNLLPALIGTGPVFHVETPEVLMDEERMPQDLLGEPPVATCRIYLDDGIFEVALFVAEDALVAMQS